MGLARSLCRGLAVATAFAALPPACGSRSGLLVLTESQPSALFCAAADYASGARDLAIYIVLDRSQSMQDGDKWGQASAAISAFVKDPATAGIAVAVGYFPHGFACATDSYVTPAVFAKNLPEDASVVTDSLAKQKPEGGTPTRPALHGAIEFARALMLAEPSRRMVVGVVSDGAPLSCDSTPTSVADVAKHGSSGTPQVLTFAIGLRDGYDLDLLAEAGGTGKPLLVGEGPGAAQELVDALRSLRKGQTECRFAVPPVAGAKVRASDVQVGYRLSPSSGLSSSPRLGSSVSCATVPDGFVPQGDGAPAHAELCPALCQLLHDNPDSHVTVVAGCAGGLDASTPPPPLPDGGDCGGIVSLTCVKQCGSSEYLSPVCIGSHWQCPAGSVDAYQCTTCAPVPHACCIPDGTLVDAQCIDGAWVCPPGGTLYGTGSCKAPAVCAKSLPCAIGQLCKSPSFSCGTGTLAGHCEPEPSGCAPGGPAVCGCDGQTYGNACSANEVGVDLSAQASCLPPAFTFACGPLFCNSKSEICRKTTSFGGAVPVSEFACLAAPAGCATGCGCKLCPDCPANKLCTESCSTDAIGGRTLSCNQ